MIHRMTMQIAASLMLAACSQANAPLSSAGAPSAEAPASLNSRMTDLEARRALVDQGYEDISDLRPQPDGSWTATAVLGGKQRQVLVTPNGFVFPR